MEINFANLGSSVIHDDEINIHLVDAGGFVYGVEFLGREGRIPPDEIKPDSSVQGWICFTIPGDARLERIKWTPAIFGDSLLAGLTR